MSAIKENEKINKMENTIKEMEATIKEKKDMMIEELHQKEMDKKNGGNKDMMIEELLNKVLHQIETDSTCRVANNLLQFDSDEESIIDDEDTSTNKSSKPVANMYGFASSRSTNQFSEDNKESTSGVGTDKRSKPVVKKYERNPVQKTIPLSGMLVTEDEYNEFERNFKYLLETNNKNRGCCFPRPDWLREYGFDTSKETLIKLGFKVASCQPESISKEYGWDFKSCPNTRRAHFEVLPFAGHEHKKDGTMRYVDYRPKPGSNNQTNSTVGSMGMGPSIYQDGGAVFGFGFGGSYVSSGPMMPSC